MDDNDIEISVEVKYGKQTLSIGPSNEIITIEKIIQESCKKFNIRDELKQFITLTYKDEQDDINIIMNDNDIINNSEEINPDKYILKINLDIYKYTLDNKKEEKNINKENKIKEDELNIYLEENKKLKKQLKDVTDAKDKRIKELEKTIEKMKKNYSPDMLNIIEYVKELKNIKDINKEEKIKKEYEIDIENIIKTEINELKKMTQDLYDKEKNNIKQEIINVKNEIIKNFENVKKMDDINNNINNIKDIELENANLLKKIEVNLSFLENDIKKKIYKIYDYVNPNKDINKDNKNNNDNNSFVIIDNNKNEEKIDYELNKKIQTIINDYFFEMNGKLKTTIPSDNELKDIKKEYKTFIENYNIDIEEYQTNFIKLTVEQEIQKIKFEEQKLVLDRKLKIINLVTDLNQEVNKKHRKSGFKKIIPFI